MTLPVLRRAEADAIVRRVVDALTRMEIKPDTPDQWFVLGLKPNTAYDVETDGENMYEGKTDPGGILVLSFTRKAGQSVFIHEPRRSAQHGSAAGAL